MTKQDKYLEIDNLPNRITIVRILLVPIVVCFLALKSSDFAWISDSIKVQMGWIAAWIFIVASITDFLDGHIARKKNIITMFGSFLDPIADKFLIVSALIMLQATNSIPAVIVVILVLREVYMTSLRLLARSEGLGIPVSSLGKWKTATQMIGIPFLMAAGTPWGIPMALIGTIFIYLASFLSLFSALMYSYKLMKGIKNNIKQRRAAKKALNEDDNQ